MSRSPAVDSMTTLGGGARMEPPDASDLAQGIQLVIYTPVHRPSSSHADER
jgi:hypothetical protein